jgi:acyl carrier protein
MNIESRIKTLLVDQLGVNISDIKPHSNLINELGADSLDLAEIMISIEQEFKIEIPESRQWRMTTLKTIVNEIEKITGNHK